MRNVDIRITMIIVLLCLYILNGMYEKGDRLYSGMSEYDQHEMDSKLHTPITFSLILKQAFKLEIFAFIIIVETYVWKESFYNGILFTFSLKLS